MRGMALVGTATLGISVGLYLLWRKKNSRKIGDAEKLAKLRSGTDLGSESGVFFNSADAPAWLKPLFSDKSQRRVLFREWEDVEWRKASGWKGRDLIHSPDGRGVQVLAYFWDIASLTLTGIVRFGPDAESHRGLCHGGAMTSLMDDLCGHSARSRIHSQLHMQLTSERSPPPLLLVRRSLLRSRPVSVVRRHRPS